MRVLFPTLTAAEFSGSSSAVCACKGCRNQVKGRGKMVKHIVMWKLKEEAEGRSKAENAKKIKEMLEALPKVVSNILEMQVGINENGGEFDAVLVSQFPSYDALKAYDSHPEHQKVRAFIRMVSGGRAAVDFTF